MERGRLTRACVLRLLFTLVPCVLVTKVLPTLRVLNTEGALTSYQSFLAKGSVLHSTGNTGQNQHNMKLSSYLKTCSPAAVADGLL